MAEIFRPEVTVEQLQEDSHRKPAATNPLREG